MTFIECCETVKEKGLQMIRPRDGVPAQYDLTEPFEGGEGWIWLDAFTANVVCQVYNALSPETQEKIKALPAKTILDLCWRAVK